ncbi:MAG TPA: hypothetical protein VKT21_07440, partial [Thermoplasmata archaeon]|nr:hypothetical protein [Thermoplasmata archaeon]
TVLVAIDEPCFLFGAEMPCLDPASIRQMLREFDGRSLVPMGSGDHWEVLHAIYSGLDRR